MKCSPYQRPALTLVALLALGGCTGISVSPSCPNELKVGESGPLAANETNGGAIAKYQWEVIPAEVGQVVEKDKPSTTFKATKEGEAVIRLTASDGLYQVIAQCQIHVAGTLPPPVDSGNDNADDGKDDPPRLGRRVRVEAP